MSTSLKISKRIFSAGSALQAIALLGAGVVASAVISPAAQAQDYTRGGIIGVVVDDTGAPVVGADVSVKSNEQGFTSTTKTDGSGRFSVNALPTGTYSIVVTQNGATIVEDSKASVTAGSTSNYNYSSATSSDAGGDIIVSGTRVRTNDFAATTGGTTLDVEKIAESIPVARSQTGLILLAPGTNAGDTGFADCPDCVSFGGASIAENSYYVNGLNTTNFRTFVGNSAVPFEFYRTFDVKTSGWSAEYGRALGGVTSAVTKSGSNSLEGGLVVSYSPNVLNSKSPNTFRDTAGTLKTRNDNDYSSNFNANLYLSGALIKDRLFFYGLFSPRLNRSEDTSVSGGYRFVTTSNTPFYGGKVDAIIADGHRLEGTFWSDKRTIFTDYLNVNGVTGNTTGAVTGKEVNKIGGNNWIGQYTGKFTDFFTLSASYGQNNYRRTDVVNGAALAGPVVQSTLTGSVTTVSGLPLAPTDGFDKRKVFRVDADVYVNLLGSHHFRGGLDREDLSASENTFYTGDYIYRYTPNYIRGRFYLNKGAFKTKQTAFYLQDSWNLLSDRLNLQLGIRNDRFENSSVEGKKYLDIKNQWAPRLGASFDVFGDKLTKINATFGRYYLPVATNTNIRLAGAETFYEQRFAYPAGVTGANSVNGVPVGQPLQPNGAPVLGPLTAQNTNPCPAFGPGSGQLCRTVFSDGLAGPTDTLVAAGLKPMYQDEYTIGATHKMDDYTFGVRYIHRKLGETLEDVAIDAAVLKYCAQKGVAGCSNTFSGFHQYVLANPGRDITVRLDGDCTVAGQCDVVTLKAADLGYPKPSRKYDAVEFIASKQFNGLWGFDFSYTWQKVRGNYEGSVKSDNNQDDAGLTQDFDQPGLTDGSNGILANERKHTFKLFGTVQPVEWLRIGMNLTVQSPRNFSCLGVHPTDAFASQYGAASFYCANPLGNGGSATSTLVPRGSAFKGEWTKNFDLGLQFQMPKDLGNSSIRFDIFNLFNAKAKSDFVEFGENDDGTLRQDYRLVSGYQSPRSARITWTSRFGGSN
jgi:Carboxypeptidase regulatory-like domain